jgi:hypothetical protein
VPEKFVVAATTRKRPPDGTLAGMSVDRDRIIVRLCLEPGSDPLSGYVVGADGQARAFRGWLGLAAALEQLLEEHPDIQPATTRTTHA